MILSWETLYDVLGKESVLLLLYIKEITREVPGGRKE